MAGGAHYSIGPLTTYADPGDLERWFHDAAPGHECKYAAGPAEAECPTVNLVRRLVDARQATVRKERRGRGFHYYIRKRAAESGLPLPGEIAPVDAASQRLLEVLADVARSGEACPSYSDLAERAALPDRYAARYRLSLLQACGLVALDHARRVSIRENTA